VENKDLLLTKFKIPTIILTQNKTQSQKNLGTNHLINLNLWLKLIMKKHFAEFLDFYNFSVKITTLK